MENVDCDKKNASAEETTQLNRNRSFKSKQLVRSQAIRETHSPPRVASPAITNNVTDNVTNTVTNTVSVITSNDNVERTLCNDPTESSHSDVCSDVISVSDSFNGSDYKVKHPVEIQITGGAWDRSGNQRQRAKRWLQRDCASRDDGHHLLSNNPRVACVCGACAACPHCRGRRRKQICSIKQDSGIVCSDECPDCDESEHTTGHPAGASNDGIRKSASLDAEEQTYFCRCPERKERPKPPSFSRNDSDGNEPTGADLVNFIKDVLNKNARDRMTLLKIEKELHSLVNDTGRCIVRFPVMTSYGRMLVHRCASLFQLSHQLDQTSKTSVLVSKIGTSGGRIPCTGFKEWCTATFPPSPQRTAPDHTNAKSILKRSVCALDESLSGLAAARSKSLEQRERDYERVRRRIFSSDNCSQDESQWPWLSGPVKVLTPEGGRNKLLKVQSLEGQGGTGWRGRGAVSKSHSFGGYAAAENAPAHPRLLSRQGDLASSSWRLSPSSSGYKTLSLRSTDSATPSPTGGASPEPSTGAEGALVWAVTDLAAVPLGASVIHPQTGRPLTNPDGTIYRFDPANPPILYDTGSYAHDNKYDQNNEKRRGRLEKQHSFNDNECECQPEECRSKCCCECRRHDTCQKNIAEKQEPKPQSPAKPRFEPTNQNPEPKQQFEPTNQKPEFNSALNLDQSQSLDGRGIDQSQVETERQETRSMEGQEYQYVQTYRPEEQLVSQAQLVQQEVPTVSVQSVLGVTHQKLTPIPIQDNMRPVSLTNMMYSAPVHQQYAYINQCRIEQPMQYQPAMPQEEPKVVQPTQHPENTFRIDASYPYAAVDYSACGACVDSSMQTHRSYSVPYGQVEVPQTVMPPAYPLGNVIIQQPHMQPYPYAEAVQWNNLGGAVPKVYPELYPLLHYPAAYPQYNLMYPQVIPQPYPMCQPVYPVVDKPDIRHNSFTNQRPKRNSISGSARATPETRVPYEERQRQNEIAVKIQQIKEQMSQLNVKEKDEGKRNSGNGILGSYPSSNFNGKPHGRSTNDEAQLSTAARAIVNSIRNMQAKNTYQQERTPEQYQRQDNRTDRERSERGDYRHERGDFRQERGDFRQERGDYRTERGEYRPERDYRRRPERGDQPLVHYRPPYLLRQMSPGTWCRRSPAPVHPVMNQPRRPNPDTRSGRR